jgi:hypothetical protein
MKFLKEQIETILSLSPAQSTLYFTKDASQIVTKARLIEEIENIIILLTRSPILDISRQLNVDLFIVETTVNEMVNLFLIRIP